MVEVDILGPFQSAHGEARACLVRPVLVGVMEGDPPEVAVAMDAAAEIEVLSSETWSVTGSAP